MKDKIILIAILIIFNTSVSGQVIKVTSLDSSKGQTRWYSGLDTLTGIIHGGWQVNYRGAGRKRNIIGKFVIIKQRKTK